MMSNRPDIHEVFGCVFGNVHTLSNGRIRFFYRDHVIPTAEEYAHQSHSYLALSQQRHIALINKYITVGMSVLHIHTHPGLDAPAFSSTDDACESKYAAFLRAFRPRTHFFSAVFDREMKHSKWRSWDLLSGLAHYDVADHRSYDSNSDEPGYGMTVLDRQQIFGDDFFHRLSRLAVTVIGCGGIGSVFVEQLSRLGVRHWTLIDPDKLEPSNLNRMPFATNRDVGRFKTSCTAGLIKRMWGRDAFVKQVRNDIAKPEARNAAVKSDCLVVATDNHQSREIAQELASRFVRPVVSLATQIYKEDNSMPRYYARVVSPPIAPGRWSLISCGAVDPWEAARESAPDRIKEELASHGYIDAVQAPAVYWLNSLCASIGVKLIHEQMLGAHVENGIDWIVDDHRWYSVHNGDEPDSIYTSNRDDGLFGRGYSSY